MGIVSSTLTSFAIRFAWNCQRFLDPRYRSIEVTIDEPRVDKLGVAEGMLRSDPAVSTAPPSATDYQVTSQKCLPAADNGHSNHQENRRRRAARHRYRKRPSSFDGSLIVIEKNNFETVKESSSVLVTHSMPNTLKRQPAPSWNSPSSSSSSSDSSDSEIEFMYATRSVGKTNVDEAVDKGTDFDRLNPSTKNAGTVENESVEEDDESKLFTMTAAEEFAFRTTIGRGRFSRSQNDRFLNNLRLEKRLNGLNEKFFELACRARNPSFRKRDIGDLRTIV